MTIPDEQIPYILIAVEHCVAYMKATGRDERPYIDIAESLKRKGQGKEQQRTWPRAAFVNRQVRTE